MNTHGKIHSALGFSSKLILEGRKDSRDNTADLGYIIIYTKG